MSQSSSPCLYRIAPHVHICRSGPHIVLLDLRRDRYLGVNEIESKTLGRFIDSWPGESASTPTTDESPGDSGVEMLQQMIDEGMLTRDARTGKSAFPVSIDRPDTPLIDGYAAVPSEIRLLDILRFFYASTVAAVLLRRQPLELIVARIHSRRSRKSPRCASSSLSDSDIIRIRRLLAVFRTLRPLLFTTSQKCLFNAFALSEYLARYGFFPQWVFGVATKPFRAHCWLQQGGIVFDDVPGNVNNYTPIMAV